ncbi:sodium:calcium antiporter [Sulfurifustis variabilis]|uniref:Sodium:calcium antiporter n=1 Tax=Sulfurifustis variabilis TaxID=1675686 RepID=A0A1B4V8X3_9GAMM|nr:calcium/sodium antiporter [Sulfurifustis variabilis]BAU49989.1 sodium:calcium antiporter [Sulfurifustis variabilis]
MTLQTWLLFGVGLALLIAGAQLLVNGAATLARAFGISSLVIGLTVVAFGTSTPELAVTAQAAVEGRVDLAVGNVVGSNIFNVLFILGLSALIAPLTVSRQLVRLDVPLMVGVSLIFLVLALDGRVSGFDGLLLVGGIVGYTIFAIREGRKEAGATDSAGHASGRPRLVPAAAFVLAGLALLVLGARWLVDAAVTIARDIGFTEAVIGLTLVAAGTSLPEVATSVVAAVRGERDIAVGNVVGSNLYNILAILGAAALLAPEGLTVSSAVLRFDLPVMIAVAVACLPIFFTGGNIARWEGALFFGYYVAYAAYLVLDSTGHDALPAYSTAMLEFVLPLTMVTLLVLVLQALRRSAVRPGG